MSIFEWSSVKQLLIYGTPATYSVVIAVNFGIPFMGPYDPVQVFLSPKGLEQKRDIYLQIVGSILLGIPTAVGALTCLQLFLQMTVIVETTAVASNIMHDCGPLIQSIMELYTDINYGATTSRFQLAVVGRRIRRNFNKFRQHWKIHHQIQIILCVVNHLSYLMLTEIILFGSLVVVTCFYTLVKLNGNIPLVFCIGAGLYVAFYEFSSSLFFSFASIPYEKSKQFCAFWQHVRKMKAEQKQLKSCMLLAFSAGPIRKVKVQTVWIINDALLNAIATFILMKE
ncbi:unnamed protein product [Orchesella dallaii]|uniref:Odorant receptor n=1 Tax=Orchesella dallaii TaxID=48710 RepID=A0ABP1S7Q2_9HEXA